MVCKLLEVSSVVKICTFTDFSFLRKKKVHNLVFGLDILIYKEQNFVPQPTLALKIFVTIFNDFPRFFIVLNVLEAVRHCGTVYDIHFNELIKIQK